MIGTDAFQETPIVEVTRQITKHNYLVMDVKDIPRVIKEVSATPSSAPIDSMQLAILPCVRSHSLHIVSTCHEKNC